jgi:hypothetical protein
MSIRQTASFQIGAALLVGLLSTVFVTWLAMSQPWSGLTLSVPSDGIGLLVQVDETGPSAALPKGARLIAISAQNEPQSVTLEALDLTEEPDTLSTPQILARFLKRQQTLFDSIRPVKARFQAFSGCQCHGMISSMRLIL